MKKILITFALAMAMSNPAFAHHINKQKTVPAEIISVEPIFEHATSHIPRQSCSYVKVPIYQTVQRQGDASQGALLGMILGGIIGKELTGDNGGRNAGVVIGGLVGADKSAGKEQIITGYKDQKQCKTVYDQITNKVVTAYKIVFSYDGMQGTATTGHKYNVGDKINVNLGLSID